MSYRIKAIVKTDGKVLLKVGNNFEKLQTVAFFPFKNEIEYMIAKDKAKRMARNM
jgi:hypothetical protein